MSSHEVAMWQHGQKLLLAPILEMIGCSDEGYWELRDFDGVISDDASSVAKRIFMQLNEGTPVTVSCSELKEFAAGLDDLNEINVAWSSPQRTIRLTAFDSSYWEIEDSG